MKRYDRTDRVPLILLMFVGFALTLEAPGICRAAAEPPWVDVAEFLPAGAGEGVVDCSAALQKAIDVAGGREVRVPAGRFRLGRGLRRLVTAQGPGLKIAGAGMGLTVLLADFDGGLALEISSTAPRVYQVGGYVRDLTLAMAGRHAGTVGLSVTSFWFGTFERVEISGFSSDGFVVPLRRDLSVNPDDYQTLALRLVNCRIVGNKGWGINCAGGHAAASLSVENCQVVNNGLGGIYLAGQMQRVTGTAVSGNGESGGGGIVVDSVHASPNGLVIEQNEFDGNREFHLWLRTASGGEVSLNRFISKERQEVLWPPVHVLLSDQGRSANNLVLSGNYHRSDTPSDLPLSLYQAGRETVACEVRNAIVPARDNTRKLTRYAGFENCFGCQAVEGNRAAVTGKPMPAPVPR